MRPEKRPDPPVPTRGRFAPSPTGELHLGNARTALLAWLHARASGGAFVLRVEDLDSGRVRPAYLETQLADLRWLGLDWDEGPDVGGPFGPYLQSERQERFAAAIERLEAAGLVYRCYCSRKEVARAASAPHGLQDEGPRYPGTCAAKPVTGTTGKDRPYSLRFRVSPGMVRFEDLLQGPQAADPAAETGDFVIRRRDGVAAYQLAVVVDDIAMGITHVVRGADLLSSTARQILLYQALGAVPPAWLHVPLLLGPDGERLSKRHGATSLAALREMGVPAEEVVGLLAGTVGLAGPGERMTAAELLPRFSVERLPREATRLERVPWGDVIRSG